MNSTPVGQPRSLFTRNEKAIKQVTMIIVFDLFPFFQYAHKLAYLVGQNIGKEPHIELANRLFFL